MNPCQPTCEDPNKNCSDSLVIKGSKYCNAGCICLPGFVREVEGGACIPVADCAECEDKCKENEEFGCTNLCQATCEDPKRKPCHGNPCIFGCNCKHGYVKDADGNCIPASECPVRPPKCGHHEEFSICGTACPDTCDNYMISRPCTTNCVRGCFCKDGYVINTKTNKCIPKSKCRKYF